jgi:hypothetical protein
MQRFVIIAALAAGIGAAPVTADSTEARCDIYPKGEDQVSAMLACTFGQRQGYITITRADGITHDLSPVGDAPGNFRDQDGRAVYREGGGLGDQGMIFRLPDESVYVYWDTSALKPQADKDNPTAPFSTTDYDATTLLRCRAAGAKDFGECPAGISRMDNRQASITVQSPQGERFTINFMTGYVNATNREVKAELKGDTWTVTVENGELYEVPLAAIEGG